MLGMPDYHPLLWHGVSWRIHTALPQIAVVILTMYNEDELMLRGLRAGACGYLLKDINRKTLFHARRTAARGKFLPRANLVRMEHANHYALEAAPELPCRPLPA